MRHDQAIPKIPDEFVARFEAERARRLRRRALWYCAAVILLMLFSLSGTVQTLFESPREELDMTGIIVESAADLGVLLVHATAALVFAAPGVTRRRVVGAMLWLVFLSGAIVISTTPFLDNSSVVPGAVLTLSREAAVRQGIAAIAAFVVLHWIACVLVALTPAEGLRPLVPLLLYYGALVHLVKELREADRVMLIGISLAAGIPGLAYSWWRHRSFSQRVHADLLESHYRVISASLKDARRLHEAIFPKAIESGPVRVVFHYQPMSQIGGDYLFVHSAPGGRDVCAVIIDITGHGVVAALGVNRLYGELVRLFGEDPAIPPAEVLKALNRYALATLSSQAMLASAICFRVTVPPGQRATVTAANAGHPPAFVCSLKGAMHALGADATVLGVLDPEEFQPRETTVVMETPCRVIACTDGAIEAITPGGAPLGVDGWRRMIGSLQTSSGPGEMPRRLAGALGAYGGGQVRDDVLIVEVAATGE